MLALATVVEIDNRFSGQRFKLVLPIPRPRLIARLKKYVGAVDPETGDALSCDGEPFGCAPLEGCVFIDPRGPIRVVIYATGTQGTVARIPALDSEQAERLDFSEAPGKLSANLAKNLRRMMDQAGISLEVLAAATDIAVTVLQDILANAISASIVDVLHLAEFFGVPSDSLLWGHNDQEAGGWN